MDLYYTHCAINKTKFRSPARK